MKKIILIDGHSILNRAFYGVPPLTTVEGLHTNAVYGFLNILLKLIEEETPDGLAVAFDLSAPTFRHKQYPEYKGTRKPMPEELHEQVGLTKEMLAAMRIPVLSLEGYEADDIIGTLAKRMQTKGWDVVVVSGDRDLLQLADVHIRIALPRTVKGQTTVTNYTPEQVKEEFGVTPAGIIELKALMGDPSDNIPGLPGVGEKTATQILQQYGTIENAREHATEVRPPRASRALLESFEKARLSKWLATISLDVPFEISEEELAFHDPYTREAYALCQRLNLKTILKRFEKNMAAQDAPLINPAEASLWETDDRIYVSNLKQLFQEGKVLPGKRYEDIGIVQYLINPLTAPKEQFSLEQAEKLLKTLEEMGMGELYTRIELPLVPVLAKMEQTGIRVDAERLREYGEGLKIDMQRLETEIYQLAGEIFNINSPKQLGIILFEKLGLKGSRKTKSGYSTSADILEKLAPDYRIVAAILEYRGLAKLYSTYAQGLLSYIREDGRIHGTFHQTVTATGRLSSADPNLQNIPVRTELGSRIRDVFLPKDGYLFVDADYSQIELRILASMSNDENLIAAYRDSMDIHTTTAAAVFHVSPEEVTPEMRRNAKAVNFGVVYGISAFGLSQGLSITREEAKDYIHHYFQRYPGVKRFLDEQIRLAKEQGFVSTLYGRRRPIPELTSANFMMRQFGERVAMNSPIQGTAADIMKLAMLRVSRALEDGQYDADIVLQVHDELLVEVREDQADAVLNLVKQEMENASKLKVTLAVEAKIGKSWLDAK